MLELHGRAFDEEVTTLPVSGFYRYRKGGERHAYEGGLIHMLQHACSTDSYSTFKKYSDALHKQAPINLRDLLDFRSSHEPVSVAEVESITEIRQRLITPGTSTGTQSGRAHARTT